MWRNGGVPDCALDTITTQNQSRTAPELTACEYITTLLVDNSKHVWFVLPPPNFTTHILLLVVHKYSVMYTSPMGATTRESDESRDGSVVAYRIKSYWDNSR